MHITRDTGENILEWYSNILIAVASYLLGMVFTGSFPRRKWLGNMDIFLHKVLKRARATSTNPQAPETSEARQVERAGPG